MFYELQVLYQFMTMKTLRCAFIYFLQVVDDPEFEKLQLKIIKFLGRLGENNSALLENAFENVDKVAIAWDSVYQNHLKYAIPFVDMKPEIYFGNFFNYCC